MMTLQPYLTFAPTVFDARGAFLPDRQDWLIAPVSHNRDSDCLTESNWDAALKSMGGEGDDVEVHRFSHWGPGWFEVIIVRPGSPAEGIAEDLADALENYPVLDDDDFSRREDEEYLRAWNDWGWKDFVRSLAADYGLSERVAEFLHDQSAEALRKLWEAGNPSGEYCVHESSGISIRFDRFEMTRDDLGRWMWARRKEGALEATD